MTDLGDVEKQTPPAESLTSCGIHSTSCLHPTKKKNEIHRTHPPVWLYEYAIIIYPYTENEPLYSTRAGKSGEI